MARRERLAGEATGHACRRPGRLPLPHPFLVLVLVVVTLVLAALATAQVSLSEDLYSTKVLIGHVRDAIVTSTDPDTGEPKERERAATGQHPSSFMYNDAQGNAHTMPLCEDVCPMLPGGGISPPSLSMDLVAQGLLPCSTPCYYPRFMVTSSGVGDLFSEGVEADMENQQGRFVQAPIGLYTVNFVSQVMYTYVPPRGTKSAEACAIAGLSPGCPYGPGDVNPYGLRIIDLSTGRHMTPPHLDYAPIQMEYDLLSKSVLFLTTGFPKTNPPTYRSTLTGEDMPILSLIALDAETGVLQTMEDMPGMVTGGPLTTLTFCRDCSAKPDPSLANGFQFLFDYTDSYTGNSTFDQTEQVFWTVLWNRDEDDSKTLFGIRRVTDFDSPTTVPAEGRWNLRIDFSKMQMYAWPKELHSITSFEFVPQMTTEVPTNDGGFEFVPFADVANAKMLYAVAHITDKAGPCAPRGLPSGEGLKCGVKMTSAQVDAHNAVNHLSSRGSLTYTTWDDAPRCMCPAALVQLNIDYSFSAGTTGFQTLNNAGIDATGDAFKILKWLDGRYEAGTTWNSPAADPTTVVSASTPLFGTSALFAMQPTQTLDVADEEDARFFFTNFEMDETTDGSGNVIPPPRPSWLEDVPVDQAPQDVSTPVVDTRESYNIRQLNVGTDLSRSTDPTLPLIEANLPLKRPPVFMFSEDQYSKMIQKRLAAMYVVATAPARTFVRSTEVGLHLSEKVCTTMPITCASCQASMKLELEGVYGSDIADADFLSIWTTLYNDGTYPRELWVQDPQRYDRRGNALPRTWSFSCPERCDRLPCVEDAGVVCSDTDPQLKCCPRACKAYIKAGTLASIYVTAITIFGTQAITRNDNFTVMVRHVDPFPTSPAGIPMDGFTLGPTFRLPFWLDDLNEPIGDRLTGSDVLAEGQTMPDPVASEWDYPNYHNKSVAPLLPSGTKRWMADGESLHPDCAPTVLVAEGRCFRSLSRAVVVSAGNYVTQIGLDRAGEFEFFVGFRGKANPFAGDGTPLLGIAIKNIPITLTVVAGLVDARFSSIGPAAVGEVGHEEATIGVPDRFHIIVRDMYGNDIQEVRTFVSRVVMKGVETVQASTEDNTLPTARTVVNDASGNPFESYAELVTITTGADTGRREVQYHMTKRARVQPFYNIYVTIKNKPIAGPLGAVQTLPDSNAVPWILTVRPAPTDATSSFITESGSSDVGLGVTGTVVSGAIASFKIRAQDRFGNPQGFPDAMSYAETVAGGFVEDFFMVVVEDANGNCGVGVVGNTWTGAVSSGAAWGVKNQAGTRNCWSTYQVENEPWTDSSMQKPPYVKALRLPLTTHTDGLYRVEYVTYKSGLMKLTTYLCEAANMALATPRCGSLASPNKPLTSAQTNVFGTSVGPTPVSGAGALKFPHTFTSVPGPTRPGRTVASGVGVTTFAVGDQGPDQQGVRIAVTVKDENDNVKINPEAALLQNANYPSLNIKYQTDCTAEILSHPTAGCAGIYQRYVEGVTVNETPLRLSGATTYNANTGTIVQSVNTKYLGGANASKNGVFDIAYSTTLAGRWDVSILLSRGTTSKTLETTRLPIMGVGGQGTTSWSPYSRPHPLVVTPSAFSAGVSEVFYFTPPAITGGGARTAANSRIVSSHQDLSHQFTTSSGIPVAAMTDLGVIGTAGVTGTFYVLIRDKYGNAKVDYTSDEAFATITVQAFDPATLSTRTMKSACTAGASDVTLAAVPDALGQPQGVWGVTYCDTTALTYSVNVANAPTNAAVSTQELTRMVYDNSTGSIAAGSQRFTLTVQPAPADATMFTASGPGLSGATIDGHPNVPPERVQAGLIYVTARDAYGNQLRPDTAAAKTLSSQLHLRVARCPASITTVSGASYSDCLASTKVTSDPTKTVNGTQFTVGLWTPASGRKGVFYVNYTPKLISPSDTNTYYAHVEVRFGGATFDAAVTIGTAAPEATDRFREVSGNLEVLGFHPHPTVTSFPNSIFVLCHDANAALEPSLSTIDEWNGLNMYTSYSGSTVGERQIVVISPISQEGYLINSKSAIGEIVVDFYHGDSVRNASPFAGKTFAQLEADIPGLGTPTLSFSKTFENSNLSDNLNKTPDLFTYLSDGRIQLEILPVLDLNHVNVGLGFTKEGSYLMQVRMRPKILSGTHFALTTISRAPFGGLKFNPGPTSIELSQVRHHPNTVAAAPLVDPMNYTGSADTSLYVAEGGVLHYEVIVGDPLLFRIIMRDNFGNVPFTASGSPENFALSTTNGPGTALATEYVPARFDDVTFDLTVVQTTAGLYRLRFHSVNDARYFNSSTLFRGTDGQDPGLFGLLGQPSAGATASDFYLPLKLIPAAVAPATCTFAYNTERTSVGEIQWITVREFDVYGNARPNVTLNAGGTAAEYFDVAFDYAADGIIPDPSSATSYVIAGGTTNTIPPNVVPGITSATAVGYENALDATGHLLTHIVGHGSTVPTTSSVLRAGTFFLSITMGGTHVQNSPLEMTFNTRTDKDAYSPLTSYTYGPGVSISRGTATLPASSAAEPTGTVRRGDAVPVYLQLRDKYENLTSRRPLSEVLVEAVVYEPNGVTGVLGAPQQRVRFLEDLEDGEYVGRYKADVTYCACKSEPCTASCETYMVVKIEFVGRGTLATSQFYWYDEVSGATPTITDTSVTPVDDNLLRFRLYPTGASAPAGGIPFTDGAVIQLLPGVANPAASFAEDPDCNTAYKSVPGCLPRVVGNMAYGNMTAAVDRFNFKVRFSDKFNQPKTDMDPGSALIAKFWMISDQFGSVVGRPFGSANSPDHLGSPVWTEATHPDLNRSAWLRALHLSGPDTDGLLTLDTTLNYDTTNDGINIPRAGFYELSIQYASGLRVDGTYDSVQHLGLGSPRSSPYPLSAQPGISDPGSQPGQASYSASSSGRANYARRLRDQGTSLRRSLLSSAAAAKKDPKHRAYGRYIEAPAEPENFELLMFEKGVILRDPPLEDMQRLAMLRRNVLWGREIEAQRLGETFGETGTSSSSSSSSSSVWGSWGGVKGTSLTARGGGSLARRSLTAFASSFLPAALTGGGSDSSGRLGRKLAAAPASALTFTVLAGEVNEVVVALRDANGNAQAFNPLRKLDEVGVTVADDLRAGESACAWLPPARDGLAYTLDPASAAGCRLVHTNHPTESDKSETGLNLSQANDTTTGTMTVVFTLNNTLPAVNGQGYLLGINLNSVPLSGSPFEFFVTPGPLWGPTSEVLTWALDPTNPDYVAGQQNQFILQARDRMGNNQFTNTAGGNIQIDMSLKQTSLSGATNLVRACTRNSPSSDACAAVLVNPYTPADGTTGQYIVTFKSVASTAIDLQNAEVPYTTSVRVCGDITRCSAFDNVYNPISNPAVAWNIPFEIQVKPGPTHVNFCVTYGTALTAGGTIGYLARFVIESRDQYSNRQLAGGDQYTVLISSATDKTLRIGDSLPAGDTMSDLGVGRYLVEFMPATAGTYSVQIQLTRRSDDTTTPTNFFGYLVNQGNGGGFFRPTFRGADGNLSVLASGPVDLVGVPISGALPEADAGVNLDVDIQMRSVASNGSYLDKQGGGELVVAQLTTGTGAAAVTVDVDVIDFAATPRVPFTYGGRYAARVPGALLTRVQTYTLRIQACRAVADLTTSGASYGITSVAAAVAMADRTCLPGETLTDIPGSPYNLRVRAAEADATTSFALELADPDVYANNGAGWMGGEVASFQVQLRDQYGNNTKYDPTTSPDLAMRMDVSILGLSDTMTWARAQTSESATLSDMEYLVKPTYDGDYTVSFMAHRAQRVQIAVMLTSGGTVYELKNSGAVAVIRPGHLSPANSILDRTLGDHLVGDEFTFVIQARDAFSNNLIGGGHNFSVVLTMSDLVTDPGVGDNPLYAQSRSTTQSSLGDGGLNDLTDLLNGDWSAVLDAFGGTDAVPDMFNKNGTWTYTSTGMNDPSVTVRMNVAVTDNQDGTYGVTFMNELAGNATLSVYASTTLADGTTVDQNICTSAAAFEVCRRFGTMQNGVFLMAFDHLAPTSSSSEMHSYIYSEFGYTESIPAGETASMVIKAYDKYKNSAMKAGYQFTSSMVLDLDDTGARAQYGRRLLGELRFTDYMGGAAPPGIPDLHYVIDYLPTKTGRYQLDAKRLEASLRNRWSNGTFYTLPSTPSLGEPGFTVLPGPIDSEVTTITHSVGYVMNSFATFPHLALVSVAGEPTQLLITGYDAYANRLTTGGDSPQVKIGILFDALLTDNGDGTYTGTYTVPAAEDHDLRITINGFRVQRCASCRIAYLNSVPLDPTTGVAASDTDAYFNVTRGGFELAVLPSVPSISRSDLITSLDGTMVGAEWTVTVDIKDSFFNAINPNIGMWACDGLSLADQANPTLCVADPTGYVRQVALAVEVRLLRAVAGSVTPSTTVYAAVQVADASTGLKTSNFTATIVETRAGYVDVDIVFTATGADPGDYAIPAGLTMPRLVTNVPTLFDSTRGDSVTPESCPAPEDAARFCPSSSVTPTISPASLSLTETLVEGTGTGGCRAVGSMLIFEATPRDSSRNYLQSVPDSYLSTRIVADTASTPLQGVVNQLADISGSVTSSDLLQTIYDAGATAAGVTDAEGDTSAVREFPPPSSVVAVNNFLLLEPDALLGFRRIEGSYRSQYPGRYAVSVLAYGSHVSGSPFHLVVYPDVLGGTVYHSSAGLASGGSFPVQTNPSGYHPNLCTLGGGPGASCTRMEGWNRATCAAEGTCSTGAIPDQIKGLAARFEIIPRDVYGNRIREDLVTCNGGSGLAGCTGVAGLETCPVRVRAEFRSSGGTTSVSSHGAAGTWPSGSDVGSLAADRPTVKWDAAASVLVVHVPMLHATPDGAPNAQIWASIHSAADSSNLGAPDAGLAVDGFWEKNVTVLDTPDLTTSLPDVDPSLVSSRGDGLAGAVAGASTSFTFYAVSSVCRTGAGTIDMSISDNVACAALTNGEQWVTIPTRSTQSFVLNMALSEVLASPPTLNAPTIVAGADGYSRPNSTFVISYSQTFASSYFMSMLDASGALMAFYPGLFATQASITVYAGPPDALKSTRTLVATAFSAGLQIGSIVQLYDQYDNLIVANDHELVATRVTLAVRYVGPDASLSMTLQSILDSTVVVRDLGAGEHLALFAARQAGNYELDFGYQGMTTVDSVTGRTGVMGLGAAPLAVTITPAEPSALAQGTTLQAFYTDGVDIANGAIGPLKSVSEVFAGTAAGTVIGLLVQVADEYENEITQGGAAEVMSITVSDSAGFETIAFTDRGDGSYVAFFTPTGIGHYGLLLSVNGKDADRSNGYTAEGTVITIATDPTKTTVDGSAVTSFVLGSEATGLLISRDGAGKDKSVGGDAYFVRLTAQQQYNVYGVKASDPSVIPVVDQAVEAAAVAAGVAPTNLGGVVAVAGQYLFQYTVNDAFGTYDLEVLLGADAEGNGGTHVSGSPFAVIVEPQTAPQIGFARFSPQATSLVLVFYGEDKKTPLATNAGGLIGLDDCTKIFDADTVALFGAAGTSLCSFRSPSELVVYLGYRPTVKPEDPLTLRDTFCMTMPGGTACPNNVEIPGIINKDLTSARATGTSSVTNPDNAPAPTLILRAPRRISKCDDLTIDASGSYGGSGRDLKFSWGMMPNVPNEQAISTILEAATLAGVQTKVHIPGSLLAEDIDYTFFVEVRTFLGVFRQRAATVMRSSHSIPRMIIEGDPVVRAFKSEDTYVSLQTELPSGSTDPTCNLVLTDTEVITYTWEFDAAGDSRDEFEIHAATKNTRVMAIPSGKIVPGETYYLKVTGSVAGREELSNTATVVVQAKYEPLVVLVEAPSRAYTSDEVLLTMERSSDPNDPYDPDDPSGSPRQEPFGPFNFSWTCYPINADGSLNTSATCFDDVTGILAPAPTEFSVTVPAGKLEPGSYRFIVVASKEPLVGPEGTLGRTVQVTTDLLVEAEDPTWNAVPVPGVASLRRRALASRHLHASDELDVTRRRLLDDMDDEDIDDDDELRHLVPSQRRERRSLAAHEVAETMAAAEAVAASPHEASLVPKQPVSRRQIRMMDLILKGASNRTQAMATSPGVSSGSGSGSGSFYNKASGEMPEGGSAHTSGRSLMAVVPPTKLSAAALSYRESLPVAPPPPKREPRVLVVGASGALAQPPIVFVQQFKPLVNSKDKVALTSDIKLTYPSTVITATDQEAYLAEFKEGLQYQWTVQEGLLDLTQIEGDLADPNLPATISTRPTTSKLVILPDSLAPGASYKLRVTATDIDTNISSYADVSFSVNGMPTSGTITWTSGEGASLVTDPTTGAAADTVFHVSASAWEDDQAEQLKYSVWVRLEGQTPEKPWVPIVAPTTGNVLRGMIVPPITNATDQTVGLRVNVEDRYGGVTSVDRTMTITPVDPFEPDGVTDKTNTFKCRKIEHTAVGCPCEVTLTEAAVAALLPTDTVCTEIFKGDAAIAIDILGDKLFEAEKLNNTAALLTRAKSGAMLLNRTHKFWTNDLATVMLVVQGDAYCAQDIDDPRCTVLTTPQRETIAYHPKVEGLLKALIYRLTAMTQRAAQGSFMSAADVEMFADSFQELVDNEDSTDPEAVGDALEAVVSRSDKVCVSIQAAGGVAKAMSSVDGKQAKLREESTASTTQARRLAARRVLLEGGASARDHAQRWLAEDMAVTAQRHEQQKAAFARQNSLTSNLGCNIEAGESGQALATANVQMAVNKSDNPSGTIALPDPSDGTPVSSRQARRLFERSRRRLRDAKRGRRSLASVTAPGFTIPANTSPGGNGQTIAASANVHNPYANSANAQATTVASSVATLKFSSSRNVPVTVQNLSTPIEIMIPTSVTGSACRRTIAGCRFYNDVTQNWETTGLQEKERTDTYIICESIHLTAFGGSADDVVPEFNAVDPIGDADMLTKISMENALVFFVLGALIGLYAIMLVVVNKLDKVDRARARIERQMSQLDSRLSAAVDGDDNLRKKGMLARASAKVAALVAVRRGAKQSGPNTQASAAEEDLSFGDRALAALMDDHDLLGVIYTQPTDLFTRSQRLTVLFAMLLGQICVCAIFFGIDPSNIGAKAMIGVITAVLLAPSKFGFRYLFGASAYIARAQKRLKPTRTLRRPRTRPVAWRIRIWTSDKRGAGTDSTVSFSVRGEKGECGPFVLPAEKAAFERGQMDEFTLVFAPPGAVSDLTIGHNGRGWGAGWHLEQVELANLETGDVYRFHCGLWIDSNPKNDGGLLQRTLVDPEVRVDEEILATRRREVEAIERAAALAAQQEVDALNRGNGSDSDDSDVRLGLKPRRPRADLRSRLPGSVARLFTPKQVGPQTGLYLTNAQAGAFATPPGVSPTRIPLGMPSPPPAPAPDGPARPRRVKSTTSAAAAQELEESVAAASPPPPGRVPAPADAPVRPRLKARAAALQALGVIRSAQAAQSPSNGPRPAGTPTKMSPTPMSPGGLTAGNAGTTEKASAVDDPHRVSRIRDLVGSGQATHQAEAEVGELDPALYKSVKLVQVAWRRTMNDRKRARVEAATMIQSWWRGHVARMQVLRMLGARASGRSQLASTSVWFTAAHKKDRSRTAEEKRAQSAAVVAAMQRPKEQVVDLTAVLEKFRSKREAKNQDKDAGGPLSTSSRRMSATGGTEPDPRLSLPVRNWVRDAPQVAAADAELMEERALQLQAQQAKAREARRALRRKQLKERKLKRGLPRWFIYPTYVLAGLFSLISVYFIILYGLLFPPAVARAWLLSSFFSTVTGLFLQDPLRILIMTWITMKLAEMKKRDLENLRADPVDLPEFSTEPKGRRRPARSKKNGEGGGDGGGE